MKKQETQSVLKNGLLLFVCLFVAGFLAGSGDTTPPAARNDSPAEAKKLEAALPGLMQKAAVPGLSIALLQDGKIAWYKGFGVKNGITAEPVRDDTVFEAASLSKPLFAYYIMKQVEQGLIELDKPLYRYLPREKLEKDYVGHSLDKEGFRKDWFEKITARHVLSHSSGLPHGEPRDPLPIFFEPGTKFKYSADGYYFLQLVVEHLKNAPLEVLMKKEIFEPLAMTSSSMVWQEAYEQQAAVGHDIFGDTTGQFRKRTRAHGAASLYTTAPDYARFVAALLDEEGLKKETFRLMLQDQIPIEKDKLYFAIGLGKEKIQAGEFFWQWGDYGTFRNYLKGFKKEKKAVVFFTNSFLGLSIARDIVNIALGCEENPALDYLNYLPYDAEFYVFARLIKNEGVEKAISYYHGLKKDGQTPTQFNEQALNFLGYTLLGSQKSSQAIRVFQLVTEEYPTSANAFDSLAEACYKSGNKDDAIIYYKKVLEVIPKDPRPDKETLTLLEQNARDMLTKIQAEGK